jgi:uncharacterized protein (UPF0276 family)
VIAAGFTLPPDQESLAILEPLILEEPDLYEVGPETLWRRAGDGALGPNGYHRRFAELRARTGRPFVAHGVGFSLGGGARAGEQARRRRWLRQIAADHAVFDFRWYTDHLGVSAPAGLALTLPLPLPQTRAAAALVARQLRALQAVVPEVGLENTAHYFLLGDALEEPAFIARCLAGPRTHLLLDLHNLHTMASNLAFDAAAYLARLPLDRVIELHVSGGAESNPDWLPSGRVLRLDSHDGAVPEPVWALLEAVVPRCPNLRAVVLERMERTATEADVPRLREELRRIRRVVA